ncbi:MAG: MBL fold metallo-hydrolase [Longimicrobiales bacterium]
MPQWILSAARQNVQSLRWLGRMQLSTGAAVDVIAAAIGGTMTNLAFDPDTKHLRATLALFPDVLLGDATSEVEFVGYRQLNGIVLPTRRVSRTGGEVTRDLTYSAATLNYTMADSLAAPPAGFVVAPPSAPAEPAKVVAPGVWAVGGGAAALVVAMRDYILVVDAPQSTDAATIERIKALAPGKPIRYVVPTHHHSDHASGVKQYAAAGATIVTTPANRAYMERLAIARSTLLTDLAPAANKPTIETMGDRKRVFSDGSRTVEIHDIGPGPHAEEMLIAWIPEEGVLFQGDLIDVGTNGLINRGTNNETTMHFAEWLKRQNWNVRVYAGSHGFLRSAADFAELVSQPILR